MNNYFEYIESNKNKFLEELIEFLKIPSISSDTSYNSDIIKCADWLVEHLQKIGLKNSKIIQTKGHPIVFSEWLEAGSDKPTVLIYGHYDVQPVDPLELWESHPFQPEIRNGKIFARGTADDKGQLFTHIKAIESYLKTNSQLPCNVKLLIEGEEEAGSSHLEEFILENQDLLKCDIALISDTEWFAEGMPTICYGLRGISFFEITMTGPNRDLHSGSFGGAVDNPANALCKLISKLKDEYGRITIPGFYDDVLELTGQERMEFKKLPFNIKHYKQDLGIKEVYGELGYSTLERVWARPSLDINGIISGYTGEGAKTVLPSKATAKISMRLVPNQKASDIAKKTEKYLRTLIPPTVKVEIKFLHGGNPVLVPINSREIKTAVNALQKAFNKDVVFMREGGSIPITEIFQNILKAPPVLMGFGLPDDNVHSPNESFSLENFYGGIKSSAIFLDEISK
jgi:acetylornithine deacetylase/succinyl-diaminopimelate desuccinylase-like protein